MTSRCSNAETGTTTVKAAGKTLALKYNGSSGLNSALSAKRASPASGRGPDCAGQIHPPLAYEQP